MYRILAFLLPLALCLTGSACSGTLAEPSDDDDTGGQPDDDAADDDTGEQPDDDAADDDAADDDDTVAACWAADLGAGAGTYSHSLGAVEGYEFPMDSDVARLTATLTWASDAVWEFSVAMGARTCHDVLWVDAHGDTGEVILEIQASETPGAPPSFPIGIATYADITLLDSDGHEVGDEVDYEFTVELCNYL
jgi:hypothetical protein